MVRQRRQRSTPVRVGIFGASGTTGAELLSLLACHEAMSVAFATSRSHAGRTLEDIDPALPRFPLTDPSCVDAGDVELVFCCLPHGKSAPVVEDAAHRGTLVVDLSADFRLRDEGLHQRTYGSDRSSALAARAIYGLTELNREAVRHAGVVANPGCYPTCTALALAPLVARGWVRGPVVVDAKSGVSGAGRSPAAHTHFLAVADDVKPYKLGRAHRHTLEIEQTLRGVSRDEVGAPSIVFNPHVVPLERGMLATIVAHVPGRTADDVRELLATVYGDEPLVDVRPEGPARVRAVVRTNRAQIGVSPVEGSEHVVLTSTIDNLGKGAAGQAVQNANLMLGFPETTGLVTRSTAPTLALGEAS